MEKDERTAGRGIAGMNIQTEKARGCWRMAKTQRACNRGGEVWGAHERRPWRSS